MRNKTDVLQWKFSFERGLRPGHQLAAHIEKLILSGELCAGTSLPSQKELARLNNINANTVRNVYDRLFSKGLLYAVSGSGTYVSANLNVPGGSFPQSGFSDELPLQLPDSADLKPGSPLLAQDFLSVGLDTLNPVYYPDAVLNRYRRKHRDRYSRYSQLDHLRDLHSDAYAEVARVYFNQNYQMQLNPGTLTVVYGRDKCLDDVLSSLLFPGATFVNTCRHDSLLAQVLQRKGISPFYLETSSPDFLTRLETLAATTSLHAIYLRPQCNYPDGAALEPELCRQILELAIRFGFYIIEEDKYHEFWWGNRKPAHLAKLMHHGHVVYLAPLSQLSVYMRNTRIVCAASPLIERLNQQKPFQHEFRDLIEELAIMDMMKNGDLRNAVRAARKSLQDNLYQLVYLLDSRFGDNIKIAPVNAGFALWLEFKDHRLLASALKDIVRSGQQIPFSNLGQPSVQTRFMRLGFGTFSFKEADSASIAMQQRIINGA